MRLIYLDNAKTTKLDPEVLKEMKRYFLEYYGPPSSTEYGHSYGLKIKGDIEKARGVIAKAINSQSEEIVFTSGEIENDNLAIKGVCFSQSKKNHIITTKIERKPILDIFNSLASMGCYKTTYLDVDKDGFVDPEKLEKSITSETLLVVVQHANPEIGTIQDIEKIGSVCKKHGVLLYVDATQSFTKVPIDVKKMGVDLLSISANKIHGPKGVGALYVRKGLRLQRLFEGGEKSETRPDLPNVPGIMGFAKAIEVSKENRKISKMRDYLTNELLKIPNTVLNGPRKKRICNNVNVTFKFIEGESLLMHMSMKGIVATTGSACYSSDLKPSHVILAIGGKHEDAHGSLRLTLSKYTTKEEIDYTVKSVKEIVKKLREISPFGK